MTTDLRIAFLPLTDAAVLVAARERGFAEEEGIALDLVRTTSWATLRDRLVYGQVQAAHMLAPLAVAVTLGLSQQPAPLAAPYKLNVNGNMLVMAGLAVYHPGWTLKLIMIVYFVLMTNPISSHAIARAAFSIKIPMARGRSAAGNDGKMRGGGA